MTDRTIIGKTDWRNHHQLFGIKDADRLRHIYAIGKTGVGKSTLLLNLAISDIQAENGLCVIDPHGDVVTTLLDYVPPDRIADVVYFNATDMECPIAFNPLRGIHEHNTHLAASSLIAIFKKMWSDSWGPRLEYILRYALLTLLAYPGSTLLDIQPLLTDAAYRKTVLSHIHSNHIHQFWLSEFDKYSPQFRMEALSSILNKVGFLQADARLRGILGQRENRISIEEIIQSNKILLCNLSKGELGEEASAFLGSMLLTAIQMAALARAATSEAERTPFYLYVDEIHTFVTQSFASILSEARKYGLSLFLTHQYLDQLDEPLRAAIFGNVGTIISFRVGGEDAAHLATEFYPVFNQTDFINLPRYSIYLKLMIDGMTSKPFSATTLPLPPKLPSCKAKVILVSRATYGRSIGSVQTDSNSSYSETDILPKVRTLFDK